MNKERLEEIAEETGIPLDEVRETQLDDSKLTGWQRFRRSVRRNFKPLALIAAPVALAGVIAGINYMGSALGSARVRGIKRFDVNGDMIRDEIVIFPIKGTDHGLLGYIDGRNVVINHPPLKAGNPRVQEYDISLWDFHPIGFQIISRRYNEKDWLITDFIYIEKNEREGFTNEVWLMRGNPDPSISSAYYINPGEKIGFIRK